MFNKRLLNNYLVATIATGVAVLAVVAVGAILAVVAVLARIGAILTSVHFYTEGEGFFVV